MSFHVRDDSIRQTTEEYSVEIDIRHKSNYARGLVAEESRIYEDLKVYGSVDRIYSPPFKVGSNHNFYDGGYRSIRVIGQWDDPNVHGDSIITLEATSEGGDEPWYEVARIDGWALEANSVSSENSKGLIANWVFDEQSGTRVTDYANGINGTVGGITWGKLPGTDIPGFYTDGTGYMYTDNNVDKLALTKTQGSSFTIESWVYMTAYGTHNGYGGEIINHDSDYEICVDDYGRVLCAFDWSRGGDKNLPGSGWIGNSNQAGSIESPKYAVPLNQATHVAVTVQNRLMIVYINGEELYRVTDIFRDASNNTRTHTWLGTRQGRNQNWIGWIGNTRIWNYARSASEIKTFYKVVDAGVTSNSASQATLTLLDVGDSSKVNTTAEVTVSDYTDKLFSYKSQLPAPSSKYGRTVAVFGAPASTVSGGWDRTLTTKKKIPVSHVDSLIFQVNKADSGNWGDPPDGDKEALHLEYSPDGSNWYNLRTINPSDVPTSGIWESIVVNVPDHGEDSVYLRFRNWANSANDRNRDNWAVTSILINNSKVSSLGSMTETRVYNKVNIYNRTFGTGSGYGGFSKHGSLSNLDISGYLQMSGDESGASKYHRDYTWPTKMNVTDAEYIDFHLIKGNGNNGGETPDSGEDLYLELIDPSTKVVVASETITPSYITDYWEKYTFNISEVTGNVQLRIRQPKYSITAASASYGHETDVFGIAAIKTYSIETKTFEGVNQRTFNFLFDNDGEFVGVNEEEKFARPYLAAESTNNAKNKKWYRFTAKSPLNTDVIADVYPTTARSYIDAPIGDSTNGWWQPKEVFAKQAGKWKEVNEIWTKESGSWMKVYPNVVSNSATSNKVIYHPPTRKNLNLQISGTVYNYNLHTEAKNAGWDGAHPVNITLDILANARVLSNTTSLPALDTGRFVTDSNVTINVASTAMIIGKGGKGGRGAGKNDCADSATHNGTNGETGGDALWVRYPTTIVNNGTIAGGGGGGGGGGGTKGYSFPGGGGGGAGYGSGGANCSDPCAGISSGSGKAGSETTGGGGGNPATGISGFTTLSTKNLIDTFTITSHYNSAWCAFLNDDGVWNLDENTATFDWSGNIDFPVSGDYTVQISADNEGKLEIDGNNVVGTYREFGSSSTHKVNISAGTHNVRVWANNWGGPGQIAIRIDAPSGFSGNMQYGRGGAGGGLGQSGTSGENVVTSTQCTDPGTFTASKGNVTYQKGMTVVWNDGTSSEGNNLFVSGDSLATTINDHYRQTLGRDAEQGGLEFWYDSVNTHGADATLQSFLNAAQQELKHGGVKKQYTYCEWNAGKFNQTVITGAATSGGGAGNWGRGISNATFTTNGTRLGGSSNSLPSGVPDDVIASSGPIVPDNIKNFVGLPPSITKTESAYQKVDITKSIKYVSGLKFSGYPEYQDNPSKLLPKNRTTLPDTNTTSKIVGFGEEWTQPYSSQHHFSAEVRGYLKATTTGNHTFTLSSDDGSYLWIGDNAIDGVNGKGTTSNAFINHGGLHAPSSKSATIYLTAGEIYPLWAYMYEHGGVHQFKITCDQTVEVYHIGDGWR